MSDDQSSPITLYPRLKAKPTPVALFPSKPVDHEGYGPGGNRSFFADLAAVAVREARLRKGMEAALRLEEPMGKHLGGAEVTLPLPHDRGQTAIARAEKGAEAIEAHVCPPGEARAGTEPRLGSDPQTWLCKQSANTYAGYRRHPGVYQDQPGGRPNTAADLREQYPGALACSLSRTGLPGLQDLLQRLPRPSNVTTR
jgi:hypothetical protein